MRLTLKWEQKQNDFLIAHIDDQRLDDKYSGLKVRNIKLK